MYQKLTLPRKKLVALLENTFAIALCFPMALYAKDINERKDNSITELETIRVTASAINKSLVPGMINRNTNVGILGNKDYLNNPYNVTSYDYHALQNQQIRNLSGFINKYDASINVLGNDTYAVDLITVRGIFMSPKDTSINGLTGMAGYHKLYSNGIESIQVTKGPSAMLKGTMDSVSGHINLTTKRAENKPLNEVGLSYLSRKRVGASVDIGRRFGAEKQWGIRFNSEFRNGDGIRDKQHEKVSLNAIALDYRSEQFRASIDAMVNNANNTANRGVLMSDFSQAVASINNQLPSPPNGKINFDQRFIEQKSKDRMIMGRIESDLNDSVTAYGTIGFSTNFLAAPNIGNWFVTKKMNPNATFGSFKPAALSNFYTKRKTISSEIGINGEFFWGPIKHNWAIAGTLSQYRENVGTSLYKVPESCNHSTIYNVKDCEFNFHDSTPFAEINNKIRGRFASIAVADTLNFWNGKLQTTLGLRQQSIESQSDSNKSHTKQQQTALTPTVGIVFKPSDNISIYGNYIEELNQGDRAPINAANAGELMSPYKTKQKELGIKKDFGSWFASASIYEIKKASGLMDHDTLIYSTDGKQRNRGLEINLFGEPIKGLRLSSSTAWIKSKRISYDQKRFGVDYTYPAPRFSSKLNIEWDIPKTNQLTFLGSVNYTGKATIDGQDFYTGRIVPTKVPAWTRVDLGLSGTFKNLLGKKTTMQLMVENVFNKRYWSIGDFNNTNISVLDQGTPRSLFFTIKTDF